MKHFAKIPAAVAAILLVMTPCTPTLASTTTSSMAVNVGVVNDCLLSTTPISFGSYDPITGVGNTLQAQGSVTVECTSGASVVITLGEGLNKNGNSTPATPLRQMASGNHALGYYLFQDSGYSTVWGNTSATGVAVTGQGVGPGINLSVYGYLAAGQDVPAGNYSDSVVVTATF